MLARKLHVLLRAKQLKFLRDLPLTESLVIEDRVMKHYIVTIGGSGHPRSPEKRTAESLERRGLLEIARHSGPYGRDWQFRLVVQS